MPHPPTPQKNKRTYFLKRAGCQKLVYKTHHLIGGFIVDRTRGAGDGQTDKMDKQSTKALVSLV